MKLALQGFTVALMLTAMPDMAIALSNRTFVSGTGTDSGACPISAPCRSFAYAVTQTAANGELVVKDGAGYGPVTITQSITIANDGVGTASVSIPWNSDGIVVNAGAGDSVQLRGIELDGNGVGAHGIVIQSAGSVQILNCVIRHNNDGIYVPGSQGLVSVSNSVVADNGNDGINVQSGVSLTVDDTKIGKNNYIGVEIAVPAIATITRSTVTGSQYGIGVHAANATVLVKDSVLSKNSNGAQVDNGNLLVTRTAVMGNGNGISQYGGQLVSYGDNNINFNGTDQVGTVKKYATE